jgi:hypothetical protein
MNEGTEYSGAVYMFAWLALEIERMEGPFEEIVAASASLFIGTRSLEVLVVEMTGFIGVWVRGDLATGVGGSMVVDACILIMGLEERTVFGLELENEEI